MCVFKSLNVCNPNKCKYIYIFSAKITLFCIS